MDAMTWALVIVASGLGFAAGRLLDDAVDWVADVLGTLWSWLLVVFSVVGCVVVVWAVARWIQSLAG